MKLQWRDHLALATLKHVAGAALALALSLQDRIPPM
jgi:hypothetical protein